MPFRALATSALALLPALLVGCGGEEKASSGGSTTHPVETTDPPVPTASVPQEAPTIVALYFLRNGKVGVARRSVVAGPRIGTAALNELLMGPTAADRSAGLGSAIPAGTKLESLSIENGIATVELSGKLDLSAVAQVVFTLTQFPSVRRVAVGAGAAPLDRKRLESFAPQILVESPAPGEEASSPLEISGSANTFEATFQVEVLDASGRVLGERFVTATSGSGTRGTFDAAVPFRADRAGPGKLVVFELSAEDGSRIHEVEIPLELVP